MESERTYPPTALVIRLSRRGGTIRIEHAYEERGQLGDYALHAQVPGGADARIRRVWMELRILMAVWLGRDRPLETAEPGAAAEVPS